MSKNMTRKGLAFGAGFALVATGLAGLPANAVGLDNGFVSLEPADGDEYNIIAGADFKLEANLAAGITGTAGTLKFKVDDSNDETSVDQSGNTTQTTDEATGATMTSAGVVTLTGLSSHVFEDGDEISVAGLDEASEATTGGSQTPSGQADGAAGDTEVVVVTIASSGAVASETIILENLLSDGTDFTYALIAEDVNNTEDADNDVAIAASLAQAINSDSDSLYTAVTNNDGTVTLTAKSAGALTNVAADNSTATINDGSTAGDGFSVASPSTNGADVSAETITFTLDGSHAVGDRLVISNVATDDVVVTVGTDTTLSVIATAVRSAVNTAAGSDYTATGSGAAVILTETDPGGAGLTNPTISFTGEAVDLNQTRATITSGEGGSTIVFTADVDVDHAISTLSGQTATVTLLESTPSSGSYVFDTNSDTGAAKFLTLSSTDKNVSQTVTVTAWLDSNGNGEIDSTEYVSPTRSVNFLASSAITPSATWSPIAVGDSTVSANVTFSPTLNGAQLAAAYNRSSAGNAVNGIFERPLSSEEELAASVSYSDVTKRWTLTSKNMNSGDWNITKPSDLAAEVATYGITDNIVTLTTTNAHDLRVGDKIEITGTTVSRILSPTTSGVAFSTVLTVPTAKSFTYAEQAADGTIATTGADVAAGTTADTPDIDATTDGEVAIASDFTGTGNYKVQVQLYRYDASLNDELVDIGSKFSSEVGATVAASATTAPTFAAVPTASVRSTSTSAAAVKTGTNAANFLLSVFDKDGDPVAAGVTATITTTTVTSAGTVTVNGTKVTSGSSLVATTDANGQIAIALNNTSGAASEAVEMDADVQNVSATTFTATWQDAVYTVYDKADQRTSSFARNRAVNDGESVTMNLAVLDQWNAPVDSATHRLLVTATQNSVVASTQTVSLSAGEATVTVADSGQSGNTSVSIVVQKLSSGTWTSQDSANDDYADWAGAGDGDLANVVINYYDQTDAITLNADGASLPSGTAAELDANVTPTALTAVDTRFSSATAETYTAAETATIGGKVTNANTGIAKSGAVVTLSAPGVLFNAGGVWSLDSIDVLTNDGTFSVDAFSRVAGDIEVTVTHGAVSEDVTVDFSAVGTVDGYSVELTAPASVDKGKTFRVQGAIKDVNGNGVPLLTAGTGTNPTLTVTYQGLGLVSGSLPTTTDANGNFYFYVLVGSNDEGTATITASYDIDGTATKNDAVATSQTVYIGQAAPSDQKVNAGSFKGYVAVYALGYEGQRLSAKIGNDWVIVDPIVNNQSANLARVTDFTGAGVDIQVRIYIDRVLEATIPLTTK